MVVERGCTQKAAAAAFCVSAKTAAKWVRVESPPLLYTFRRNAPETNLPGKIALKVANHIDSCVLLDQGGAQNLLGKDGLLLSLGGDPV